MSHNPIRKDKTCLNCRHVVDQRYCPNCGQENSESRKTFHHLFIHFFEDLTHYENAFWRTIRNLLFKPSALTKEYLSGKRLSYLAPVRLYIFISFITFFLIAVIPEVDNLPKKSKTTVSFNSKKPVVITNSEKAKSLDDVIDSKELREQVKDSAEYNKIKKQRFDNLFGFGFKSIRELDSLQKFAPEEERLDAFSYWVVRKGLEVKGKHKDNKEILTKFKESFISNFPKALFLYMPIFALFLWLFHGKKRWYYFEHGIFTLHYFSFLLLISLLIFLLGRLADFSGSPMLDSIFSVVNLAGLFWMFYYFFPAHHRFYGESRAMSFLKSFLLFFINMFLISIILTLFAIYTFINLH